MITVPQFVLTVFGIAAFVMIFGAWWNRNKPPGMGM